MNNRLDDGACLEYYPETIPLFVKWGQHPQHSVDLATCRRQMDTVYTQEGVGHLLKVSLGKSESFCLCQKVSEDRQWG